MSESDDHNSSDFGTHRRDIETRLQRLERIADMHADQANKINEAISEIRAGNRATRDSIAELKTLWHEVRDLRLEMVETRTSQRIWFGGMAVAVSAIVGGGVSVISSFFQR